MSVLTDDGADLRPPLELLMPAEQTVPVVFSSPHSGIEYPEEFIAASRLDALSLRKSEDSFVDELFAAAPDHGAPLIRALFPRAFIDPNREPFELDPMMFEDELPAYANITSPRVAAGLGTIARVVASGEEIYKKKLRFADAKARIDRYYRPYHDTLRRLLHATRERFGYCLLIDCHSMPSIGAPMERDAGRERVDFVLGDCYASSCAPSIIDEVERLLRRQGYLVARNMPYSGGFVTQHYGQPAEGIHALQIEINRALYMDEAIIQRSSGFDALYRGMSELVREISANGSTVLAQ
ncbi:N-formylglutamate amidohydrolase [Rhodospirillaceae bacterium SYSU D60014]|uniref:N-formylglutamate amidohydrolase n=1 Tax=Virgifigura deserti TaxID=2268457 RepID=UPI000E66E11D